MRSASSWALCKFLRLKLGYEDRFIFIICQFFDIAVTSDNRLLNPFRSFDAIGRALILDHTSPFLSGALVPHDATSITIITVIKPFQTLMLSSFAKFPFAE
jgi:hypothetical protein